MLFALRRVGGDQMKSGDPVRPTGAATRQLRHGVPLDEDDWIGIIIGWDMRGESADPIVMWSEKFPAEIEYREQLEVINESR